MRANPSVRHLTFDTGDLPAEVRAQAWREAFSPHDVELPSAPVHGRVAATLLDRMVVRRIQSSPLSVNRTRSLIRRDGLEHLVMHLTTAPFVAETPGRSAEVQVDAVTFNDMSQPLRRSLAGENGSVVVSLARELVEEAMGSADGLHGLQLTGGHNTLLASHMRTLAAWAPMAEEADAPGVARATALMMAAAIRPSRQSLGAAREGMELARLAQARKYINQHLADGALTPDIVAQALRISRTTLFALFKPIGGVSQYIRERRLARAYQALLVNATLANVSQVAMSCGFTSVPHFARAFKEAYGVTPGEVQGGALSMRDTAVEFGHEQLRSWSRLLG
jgi:AraC-like DNA-binding protein